MPNDRTRRLQDLVILAILHPSVPRLLGGAWVAEATALVGEQVKQLMGRPKYTRGIGASAEPFRQCENCGAVVPESRGGQMNNLGFVCCAYCVFNHLGCRCKYGEFGVPQDAMGS